MSLVPDYDSNSDSDTFDSNSSITGEEKEDNHDRKGDSAVTKIQINSQNKREKHFKLPSANIILTQSGSKSGDVFSNPYREAENAKIASLEKHVKMVNKDEHLTEKNGRKICWNYRKGRCRFGSNCTFAHDSDLSVNVTEIKEIKCNTDSKQDNIPNVTIISKPREAIRLNIHEHSYINAEAKQNEKEKFKNNSKKRRPGLSESIIPSKRVIKSYNSSKNFS